MLFSDWVFTFLSLISLRPFPDRFFPQLVLADHAERHVQAMTEMLSMKLRAWKSSLMLSQSTSYGMGAPQISAISWTRPGNVTSCNSLSLRRSVSPIGLLR